MKKVLILGATGMLGHACRSILAADTTLEIVSTSRVPKPSYVSFDASKEAVLSVRVELIERTKKVANPEIVDFIESLESSNFTLVVGVHVFDHLLSPLEDLKLLKKKSLDGAHLAVVVHNEASVLRKLLNKKWPPFCLQHPQLYNPKTLKTALNLAGWEIVKLAKTTNWYHLRNFITMGLSLLGSKNPISKVIPDLEVPIKLGNIICLAKAN